MLILIATVTKAKAANRCFLWFITALSTIQRFLPLMSGGRGLCPTYPTNGAAVRGVSQGIMSGGLMSVLQQKTKIVSTSLQFYT